MAKRETADLVVVGAGMVGGWASWFAATDGAERVIVLEKDLAGQGASSRAAGMVRAQGGTPTTVALGTFSIDFYNRQRDLIGTDSGFRELGYLILATTARDERAGADRVAMQREAGLDVRWVDAAEACRLNPTLAAEGHRGGSYCATDGSIDPPRNVRAYSLAMQQAGVQLRERTPFIGSADRGRARRAASRHRRAHPRRRDRDRARDPHGRSHAPRRGQADRRAHLRRRRTAPGRGDGAAPGVRCRKTADDVRRGGGHLLAPRGRWTPVGDVEPEGETRPGPAGGLALPPPHGAPAPQARARHPGLGIRKAWCGTIDYTSDHLPILGPAITTDGVTIEGTTVASPGGHGMMWGPGVARVAADLALHGRTDVIDVTDLGMDRFDEHGRSPFYDPIALPFPTQRRRRLTSEDPCERTQTWWWSAPA